MTTNINIYILILIGAFLSACSPKTYPSSAVEYERKKGSDIVIVTSWGYGKVVKEAMIDAEKRAFEVLLFKGLPNSVYSKKMISPEIKEKHENYFLKFFEEQQYRDFISFSDASSNLEKDIQSGLKRKELTIGINIKNLKTKLKEDDLISKSWY